MSLNWEDGGWQDDGTYMVPGCSRGTIAKLEAGGLKMFEDFKLGGCYIEADHYGTSFIFTEGADVMAKLIL